MNNKYYVSFGLLMILFLISGNSFSQDPRKIRLKESIQIKAAKIKSCDFIKYDSKKKQNGRRVEYMEFNTEGFLILYRAYNEETNKIIVEREYFYDETNSLIKMSNINNSLGHQSIMEFEKTDDQNILNQITTVLNNNEKYFKKYFFNKSGQLTKEEAKSNVVMYEYYDDGRIKAEINPNQSSQYYYYDGNTIKKEIYQSGTLSMVYLETMDENGNLMKRVHYDNNNQIEKTDIYTRDNYGNVLEANSFDENENSIDFREYIYKYYESEN